MKIYTIGRSENSHIQLDSPLISRQHALLKVYPSGKMEIVDGSSNGTSLNGAPLKHGQVYKVTRKDVVTFAGESQLDWSAIPDPSKGIKVIIAVLAAVVLVVAIVIGVNKLRGGGNDIDFPQATVIEGVEGSKTEDPSDQADNSGEKDQNVQEQIEQMKKKNDRIREERKKAEEKEKARKEEERLKKEAEAKARAAAEEQKAKEAAERAKKEADNNAFNQGVL